MTDLAALSALLKEAIPYIAKVGLTTRIEAALAEIEAEPVRRCGECHHWLNWSCLNEKVRGLGVNQVPKTFGCIHWARREDGK